TKFAVELCRVVEFVLAGFGIHLDEFFFDRADFFAKISGSSDHWFTGIARTEALFKHLQLAAEIADRQNGFVHFVLAFAHSEHQVELLAQILRGSFDARIHGHFKRSGDTLRSHGEPHLIIARESKRAAWFAFVVDSGGNFLWRLVTQVPGEFIQAGLCWDVLRGFVSFPLVGAAFLFLFFTGERADDLSLRVPHFPLYMFFGLFLSVVVERGAVR